jgi:hypothetical protein
VIPNVGKPGCIGSCSRTDIECSTGAVGHEVQHMAMLVAKRLGVVSVDEHRCLIGVAFGSWDCRDLHRDT